MPETKKNYDSLPPDKVAMPPDGGKKRPTRKVASVGAAAWGALAIAYVARQVGLEMSPEEAAAFAGLLCLGVGYLVREGE